MTQRTDQMMLQITDDKGILLDPHAAHEPHEGSVVLTQGEFGTAWQRYFSDGLWHCVLGGKPRKWGRMLDERNLVLVYDAERRP